jgi:hypothetical protein
VSKTKVAPNRDKERGLNMKIVRNLTVMAAVAASLTIAAQARADTINFFLTTPETGTAPTQANAVEVTVSTWTSSAFTTLATGSSTFATVVFTNPDTAVNMAPVEINISGAFQASSTEGLAGGNSPCGGNGGPTPTCAGGGDGAGTFGTMSIETGSSNHSTITIDLLAEGTNSWLDAAAVLTKDSKGFEALVNDASNNAQDGGFYSATPLPATLPLFAGGLGFVGFLTKRRKNAKQSVAAA